jgi:hypothetical protein
MQKEMETERNNNSERLEGMDKQIFRVYIYGVVAIVGLLLFNVCFVWMSQKSTKKSNSSDMTSPAGNSG